MKSWPRPHIPTVPGGAVPRDEPCVTAHDTAVGAVVPVGPAEGTARLYVCGITPYDATHLGHAFTYLTFDLLQRAWRDAGLDVVYAQNVTDVDTPLLERAAATGRDWAELAAEQTQLFREDMTALRVIPPDHYIGVVESLAEVVSLIADLPAGTVYAIDEPAHPDLYFRTAEAPGFGGIAHLDSDEMLRAFAERGGDPDRPGKHDPLDSLVWRTAREGEPAWATTLGAGRPGWHVECTAISLRYLGTRIDVQGGGSDLAFPHHEMCGAQAVAATGEPLAAAFVHSAMVGLDGEKMSKSRGNLVFVSALRRDGVDPMAIRLALLGHHYRADWMWSGAVLAQATARLAAWRAAVARPDGAPAAPVVEAVRHALRQDLDAPAALAAVDAWAAVEGAGATETTAPALVREAVDALLGVAL